MLVIRKEQMRSFELATQQRFYGEIADLVKNQFPNEVTDMDNDELRRRVAKSAADAVAFGIRPSDSRAIAMYVMLVLVVGPRFDRVPAIHQTMSNRSLAPEARMYALLDVDSGIDWSAARAIAQA